MTNVPLPNAELVSAQILRPKAVSSMASELLLADPIRGHDVAVTVPSMSVILLCVQYTHFSFVHLSLDITISLCGVWKARGSSVSTSGVWNRGGQGPFSETGLGFLVFGLVLWRQALAWLWDQALSLRPAGIGLQAI